MKGQAGEVTGPWASAERQNAISSPITAVLGRNWVRAGRPIHLIQTPPLHSAFSLQSLQSKEMLFPLQNKQNKLSLCSFDLRAFVQLMDRTETIHHPPGISETHMQKKCSHYFGRQKASLPPARHSAKNGAWLRRESLSPIHPLKQGKPA